MRTVATALVVLFSTLLCAQAAPEDTLESGVVGLVVTYQKWDEDRPWAKKNPETRYATGVIVEGPYILTTAQMIADMTFVQIKKFGRTTQAVARPLMVDREVDLALLTVDTAGFFDDLRPVGLARETPTRGALRTVYWRGQQLESVASRVKRFEVQESFFGKLAHVFLLAQTDMSGGGWAEPVFHEGHLTGITASQKEQRVRVIPAEIISKFLERATASGSYRSFPIFGAKWQVNQNPALAAFLGQKDSPRGVLIRQVPWGSSACGVIESRDILLSIDGLPIDAEGFYEHPRLGRLGFDNILTDGHEVGDTVSVRVMRDGQEHDLQMVLRDYPLSFTLMPARRGGGPPPYIVTGGFVLRELDGDYLRSWGAEWSKNAPLTLLTRYYEQREAQRPERRRVVLLSAVLPSAFNVGYQDVRDVPVERVNGRPIDSIPDVVEALAHPVDGFHVIELESTGQLEEIVLEAAGLERATAEALEDYRIPEALRAPLAAPPDGGPDCPGDY